MDMTLTQEIRQATDWLAHGKFAICFFCSDILKVKAQGLPVEEFRTAQWKESRMISAGNMGSIVLPSQPPHPNAARVFVNWLLSREGQTMFQQTVNTPYNSEESLRTDIPKDMVRSEVRRVDGVKYLLAEKPEFMDMAPIQEVVKKPCFRRRSGRRASLGGTVHSCSCPTQFVVIENKSGVTPLSFLRLRRGDM